MDDIDLNQEIGQPAPAARISSRLLGSKHRPTKSDYLIGLFGVLVDLVFARLEFKGLHQEGPTIDL